jgi:hypothetical protein
MLFQMMSPVGYAVPPHIYVKHQTDLGNFLASYLAVQQERAQYKPELKNLRIRVPDRSQVQVDIEILEMMPNKPVQRKYRFFVNTQGQVEYTCGCEGQPMYVKPMKDWVLHVQKANLEEIRKRLDVVGHLVNL